MINTHGQRRDLLASRPNPRTQSQKGQPGGGGGGPEPIAWGFFYSHMTDPSRRSRASSSGDPITTSAAFAAAAARASPTRGDRAASNWRTTLSRRAHGPGQQCTGREMGRHEKTQRRKKALPNPGCRSRSETEDEDTLCCCLRVQMRGDCRKGAAIFSEGRTGGGVRGKITHTITSLYLDTVSSALRRLVGSAGRMGLLYSCCTRQRHR